MFTVPSKYNVLTETAEPVSDTAFGSFPQRVSEMSRTQTPPSLLMQYQNNHQRQASRHKENQSTVPRSSPPQYPRRTSQALGSTPTGRTTNPKKKQSQYIHGRSSTVAPVSPARGSQSMDKDGPSDQFIGLF
ncbi:hypothetical protein M8818_003576 [Zalaria obscura]|uniref:Uncharacterized protein n=1 Tax=Zalaria obscura TaxID=2024903 RepID=A0ACC3SFP6_9PEZI